MSDEDSPSDSNSNVKNTLKAEWSLLIEGFEEEREHSSNKALREVKQQNPLSSTLDFIEDQLKDLSQQRQNHHKRIEEIKKQLDESALVIENLVLVGSDTEDIQMKIDSLHNEGQRLSEDLLNIDIKLKKLREYTNHSV
ncbi:MAG: hypothetical protein ACK41T_00475 [Pseudobdellovibrio sp.]